MTGHESYVYSGPSAAIGELAVLTGTKRSASVQAVRDSELLQIDSERFRELVHGDSELAAGLATALARQLQESGGLQEVDGAAHRVRRLGRARRERAPFLGRAAVGVPGARLHGRRVRDRPRTGCGATTGGCRSQSWSAPIHTCCCWPSRTGIGRSSASGKPIALSSWPTAPHASGTRRPRVATSSSSARLSLRRSRPGSRWHGRALTTVVPAEVELAVAARRVARRLTGRSLGLVLSGGGARAFAHVGVCEVLAEEGIAVDRVGGTSMGAFVAAMVALGWSPERMVEVCEVEIARGAPFSDYTLPRHALIRARRGESMLRRLFGEVTLEELPLPLFTLSADLLSGQMVVHRRGSLVEAVGMSMAIPGLVPPVSHGTHLLIDGGVVNNLPIDVMAADEPGPVLAVDVMRRIGPHDLARSARVSLPTILETLSRATVLGSVERAEANRALASLVITPDVQGLSLRDFRHLRSAIDGGRRAAEAAFAAGARETLPYPARQPRVRFVAVPPF